MMRPRSITERGVRALSLIALVLTFGVARAQMDIFPSSVDARLVQGASSDELLIQLKIHGTGDFGGILSALTITIRYDVASGMSLGAGTSFCSAWSAFTPSPEVTNGGIAYRTYNGFGVNRLEDPVSDGGCGISFVPEQWYTITTIPVGGSGCTAFTLGNDAFTDITNRDFYISMGGHDVTGVVTGAPVDAGVCAFDCLGVAGGTALPGTPCDDGDPNTEADTWSADCVCIGTGCISPVITGTSNNGPVCSNNDLNLSVTATGSGPLTYAWSGSGTFSPDAGSASVAVSGATTGTYSVTVSNACGNASASIPVEVQEAPMATITYGSSPFCTSGGTATITRTGSTGGAYSSDPSGLSINASTGEINLGASSAGTYTISYTIPGSGPCSTYITTASVVLNAGPQATITYGGQPYCASGGSVSVTRTGASGGTFSSTPSGLSINGNTGAIDLGASSTGNYTVTYTIAASGGCSTYTTTANVVLNAGPSGTISYGGSPYCSSGGSASVTLAGTSGGTYSSTPTGLSINANSGAINLGNSAAGTYSVAYDIAASGGCPAFSTGTSVVVTAQPAATIAYASSPYCTTAGTVNISRTGSANGTYSATPSGLSLNANSGAINAANSDPGSYTVTYGIASSGGCPAFTTTAQVSIAQATIWYADTDGDGVGDDADSQLACEQPAGHVALAGDLCPEDPGKVDPGVCGCGIPDTDMDNDGTEDCIDGCPTDPNKIAPGICGCGIPDVDTDNDGLADCIDNCPLLEGVIGDPCDDGDPGTEDDVITEDCVCEGTLITGIGHVDAPNTGLVIYPNPNGTGILHVNIPGSPVVGTVLITVRDITGRIILRTTATPVGEQAHFALDLPRSIGAGNYSVEVGANGQRHVVRLVMY